MAYQSAVQLEDLVSAAPEEESCQRMEEGPMVPGLEPARGHLAAA